MADKPHRHDEILHESFRQLDSIHAGGDGNTVERLLEVRKYATRHLSRLASREHDKGALMGFAALVPALGIAAMESLRGLPTARELAWAPVGFIASIALGLAAMVRPNRNMIRATKDKKTFQRIIDSEVAAIFHEDPRRAFESPLFRRHFDLGRTFNIISSRDEAPARMRARLAATAPARYKPKP